MASDDFSGVSASSAKFSYTQGEAIVMTVYGQNKHTADSTTTQETVTVTMTVESEGGVRHSLNAAPISVTRTSPGAVTFEDVSIVSVSDTDGRTWSVSGRTATAVA